MRKLTSGHWHARYVRTLHDLSQYLTCKTQIFEVATNESLFAIETFACTREEVVEILRSQIPIFMEGGRQGFASYLSERLPPDFGAENIEQLTDFLWLMLQERPRDRKSATELLGHPFLAA